MWTKDCEYRSCVLEGQLSSAKYLRHEIKCYQSRPADPSFQELGSSDGVLVVPQHAVLAVLSYDLVIPVARVVSLAGIADRRKSPAIQTVLFDMVCSVTTFFMLYARC